MQRPSSIPPPPPEHGEYLRNVLRRFLAGENPDSDHAGLARDVGGFGRYAVVDIQFLSDAEMEAEIDKFVAWMGRAK